MLSHVDKHLNPYYLKLRVDGCIQVLMVNTLHFKCWSIVFYLVKDHVLYVHVICSCDWLHMQYVSSHQLLGVGNTTRLL